MSLTKKDIAMKTIEEKAKAYDEALERAKEMIDSKKTFIGKECLEQIFPELRESEDERIRKKIIDIVKASPFDEEKDILIAYLERQKEDDDVEFIPVENTLEYKLGFAAGQKEQKPAVPPYIDFVIKPHRGDADNPYDMGVSEAQDYAINRGFGIPFNDGEVFVDSRYITQTVGNILRWADDHPKKPAEWSEEDENKIESIKCLITTGRFVDTSTIQTIWNILDDLRPHWKPSEEQMAVLFNAERLVRANNYTENAKILAGLYEQLKKL